MHLKAQKFMTYARKIICLSKIILNLILESQTLKILISRRLNLKESETVSDLGFF